MTTLTNNGGADDGVLGSTTSNGKNGIIGRNDDPTPRNAAIPEGNGVFGLTQVPDGAGVFGLHDSGGVGVAGFGHPAGIGVVGVSAPSNAKGGDGVLGITNAETRNGMVGRNDSTAARGAPGAGGNGVLGFTQVPDGAGVFGVHSGAGAGVSGIGRVGVTGGSVDGVGVLGVSAPHGAKGGDGVLGITNNEQKNGVFGWNFATSGRANSNAVGNGVFGFTQVPDGAGVLGAHGAGGHGVIGTGGFGVIGAGTVIGVWGQGKGNGWAGYFSGPVHADGAVSISGDLSITGNFSVGGSASGQLTVDGDLLVTGDVLLTNRDIAERFRLAPGAEAESGFVMIITETGALEPCSSPRDTRAIGVVSGAGTLRPAITLGADGSPDPTSVPIAMTGTACCWVDATCNAVKAGDLLTTSARRGHAMSASGSECPAGAIIGKALTPLPTGVGLIPILIAAR